MKGVVLFNLIVVLVLSGLVGWELTYLFDTRDGVCAYEKSVAASLATNEKLLQEQHGKLIDVDPDKHNQILVARSTLVSAVARQQEIARALGAANCH